MTLFKNGLVVDGTGKPAFRADVLTDGSSIVEIGTINRSDCKVIDISDSIICPGFMDIHSHSDLEVLRNPDMSKKLNQGITFDLSGNCGVGVFPITNTADSYSDILGHFEKRSWTDFDSYSKQIKSGSNIGFLQAHAPLRDYVLSDNPNRKATKEEVSKMCTLLDSSLSQGCFGLSSGLFYSPCLFADRYEIVELLKVVKKHDSIFAVHHRCEGNDIVSSIDEILSYVRETKVKLEISHLKAIGTKNQDKVPVILEKINKAVEEGFDVTFDQYPYDFGSTSLSSLLPPYLVGLDPDNLRKALKETLSDESKLKALIHDIDNPNGWDSIVELCGFDNIRISSLEHNPSFDTLSLTQCASLLKTDPYRALFTILSEETGYAVMQDITQTQESMRMIMKMPNMSFGSDSLYTSKGGHPRSYNAAVHFLEEYCLKQKVLSLEEAVYRMTGKVSERLNMPKMGKIQKGMNADLVVLNLSRLKDNSTIEEPSKKPSGIEYVMVNGEFAVFKEERTNSLSGKVVKA